MAAFAAALGGVAKAADSSQQSLNQSSQGDYVPPGALPHSDQVDHALLTDPSTGGPAQGFEKSLESIIASIKKKPASGPTTDPMAPLPSSGAIDPMGSA